jgi:hypothetical protein
LGDPGVNGRIILRCFFRKWNRREGVMDWIELAHGRYKWGILVTGVINLGVP